MATPLVPHSFLFRFSFSVPYIERLPGSGQKLLALPEACRLPALGSLEDRRDFADLRLAWNSQGLGLSVSVTGRKRPVIGRQPNPHSADRLRLWIDTRNTQNIHRAGKFCHEFHLFPAAGPAARGEPVVELCPIERSRESPTNANPALIRCQCVQGAQGYHLEAWFPTGSLQGFTPDEQPRLGFYYHLHDSELGDQFLSVGREFPFDFDPGLWQTLDLVRSH